MKQRATDRMATVRRVRGLERESVQRIWIWFSWASQEKVERMLKEFHFDEELVKDILQQEESCY